MYSISDLERISGIKAHTIRIWEKRYNLLDPERTEGNHRLYSDQDLLKLLNVQQLLSQGLKISTVATWQREKIVDLVRNILAEEKEDSSDVAYYSSEWLMSALKYDEKKFSLVYNELRSRMSFLEVWDKYLIPTLHDMGQLWLTEDLVPAEEHFFSQLVRRKILTETEGLSIPAASATPALLFLPPREYHELGLLVSEYILRMNGVATINLGANLPIENIQRVITKKSVIVLITYIQGISMDTGFLDYITAPENQGITIVLNGHLADEDTGRIEKQPHIFQHSSIAEFKSFILKNLNP